jgi:hypothetical protein
VILKKRRENIHADLMLRVAVFESSHWYLGPQALGAKREETLTPKQEAQSAQIEWEPRKRLKCKRHKKRCDAKKTIM